MAQDHENGLPPPISDGGTLRSTAQTPQSAQWFIATRDDAVTLRYKAVPPSP